MARRKSKSDKAPMTLVQLLKIIVTFLRDEKSRFVIGLFFLLFAAYLVVAFISFIFTWKLDQSAVERGFFALVGSGESVENWTGSLGAVLSNVFIHKWFGLPSFAFIYIFTLYSLRYLKIQAFNFKKNLRNSLVGIIWSSIALAFVFGDSSFLLGGGHGLIMSHAMKSMLGGWGTALFLLIFLFGYLTITVPNFIAKMVAFFVKLKNAEFRPKETIDSIKEKVSSTMQKVAPVVNAKFFDEEDEDEEEKPLEQTKAEEPKAVVKKEEFLLTDDGLEMETTRPMGDGVLAYPTSVVDEVTADTELPFEVPEMDVEPNMETESSDDHEPVVGTVDKAIHSLTANTSLLVEKNTDIQSENLGNLQTSYDPTLDLPHFLLPPLDLLEDHKSENSQVTNEELISNKNKIVDTLKNYKIEIQKIKATIGPTVTLYEIIPAPGVRISKIKNLEDDIALSLSALGIRIIAPMPGRGTIGIEVPNQKPEIVSMRSVVASAKFQESKFELPIGLGKTISNETYVVDLTKMPHLLVAGATGQGKSVGLNAIITSLLYKKHPSQLKFVLVDPKKVELTLYEKLERHYLAKLPDAEEAIITDTQKVVHTLSSLSIEMDNRYELLKDAQVRNIKEYNAKFVARRLNPEKGHAYLPYIVLIIDEFADLIMTAGKEVEMPIARLAQLSRAVGIHLIVATQRPSTNIITGVIKANFPTRLAFKVVSMIDSRTILDSSGANQLIGRGDMLITQGSDMIRLQCAFIDTPELDKITDYIGAQRGYPTAFLLPEYEGAEIGSDLQIDLADRDDLFEEAARIIVMNQQGSTSLIQRKLSIGYNRAGRIIDQLEAAGIVGPFEGSKARQVLYADEFSLESFLQTFKK